MLNRDLAEERISELADYSNMELLKKVLSSFYELKELSYRGFTSAKLICMEIELAIKKAPLTSIQRHCLTEKIKGFTYTEIAEQIDKSAFFARCRTEQAIKLVQKELMGGSENEK